MRVLTNGATFGEGCAQELFLDDEEDDDNDGSSHHITKEPYKREDTAVSTRAAILTTILTTIPTAILTTA